MIVKSQSKYCNKSRLSRSIFWTVPMSTVILPYFGHAHEWCMLMMHLRKKSRNIWIDNIENWKQQLRKNFKQIKIDDNENFNYHFNLKHTFVKDFIHFVSNKSPDEAYEEETKAIAEEGKRHFDHNKFRDAMMFYNNTGNIILPEYVDKYSLSDRRKKYYLFMLSKYSKVVLNYKILKDKNANNIKLFINKNATSMKELNIISEVLRVNYEI